MPLPAGATVGTLPDGTLTWIDAQGNALNADGTPTGATARPLTPTAATPTSAAAQNPVQALGSAVGPAASSAVSALTTPSTAPGTTSGTTPATQGDPATRQAVIDSLTAQHKGLVGAPAPVTLTVAGTTPGSKRTQATGYDLYTFGDGSSIEMSDGTVDPFGTTRNYKEPASATKTPTTPAEQIAAGGGPIAVGTGTAQTIWQKTGTNPDGTPIYTQTDASTASQQLANQQAQADLKAKDLANQKTTLDNQVLADPANQALVQQQAQLDAQYKQAQIDSQQATTAKTQFDQQIAAQEEPGKIAQQGATLGQTQATTQNTLATAQKTTALLPTDVQSAQLAVQKAQQDLANNPTDVALKNAYTAAQTAYENAQTAALQNKPTEWTPNITAPTTQYWDPTTQSIKTQTNPNYLPTDPGRMVQQLQQQASTQQQLLQQQVAANKLSPDQAASQFDQWWSANVEPMKADIAQTQATQQAAIGQQQAMTGYYQAQAANLPATLAQNASDAAQKNALAMLPYMVNPSAATTPAITTNARGFPQLNPQQVMQNASFSMPNLQEIGRQGAAAALANISPTAQMHLQTPGPPLAQPAAAGMPPLSNLLNMNQYGFNPGPPGGGTPPMPPSGGPAPGMPVPFSSWPATQAPSGGPAPGMPPMSPAVPPAAQPPMSPTAPPPPGIDWNALMARQQADAALQQQQAAIPADAWGTYAPAS
jgi:hypothetical protein